MVMKSVAVPAATHQCYVNGSVVQCSMGSGYEEGVDSDFDQVRLLG